MLQNQTVSTLLGVTVGGIITLIVTVYSINKQFTNQKKLFRQARIEEEIRALVTIREEISRNGVINNKAQDLMEHMEGCELGIKMPIGFLNSSILSGILLRTYF